MSDLKIVYHPHPSLTWKSKDVVKIDAQLQDWVAQMFDLMYEANGIGLAANQVALPYRLFVINPTGDSEQKDQEQAFINPQIIKGKGSCDADEGCLSMPEVFGPVTRFERITVEAFDVDGTEFGMDLTGLAARVVQHENDHLDGVMFTDRVQPSTLDELSPLLDDLTRQLRDQQSDGRQPTDKEMLAELKQLEAERT
ncbi:UNVERIFIED_CONTAM: hypothetical protein GTU68_022860 [Idotea baltica]|nr:hypothetical protein [Idotea baltica]